jgi:hypothetical protein
MKNIHILLLMLAGFITGCMADNPGEVSIYTDLEERGFVSLLDDGLSEWKGQISEDPRRIPGILEGLNSEERLKVQEDADELTFKHWYLQDEMLLYDGTSGVGNLETVKEFGDFELVLDWKIGPKGDSGIYLRNMPQVQIWDPHHQGVGSGGLFNNNPRIDPISTVDKPVGEWNNMHIKMIKDTVWVTLNGELVIDGEIQGNHWANFESPALSLGPIVLQSHGTPLWFRNVYIKELD